MSSSCSQFVSSHAFHFSLPPSLLHTPPSKSPRHAAPVPAPKIPRDASNSAICHLQGLADIFNQKVIGVQVETIFTPLANALPVLKAYLRVIVVRGEHSGFGERQQKQKLCLRMGAFCLYAVHAADSALWFARQKYIKGYM